MKTSKIISKIVAILLLIILVCIQPISFAENISNDITNDIVKESMFIENTIIENENLEFDKTEDIVDEELEKFEQEEVVESEEVNENDEINNIKPVFEEEKEEDSIVSESNVESSANYANVYYRTHAQNIGWQRVFSNGETAGTQGRALRLEAIEITLDSNLSGNIIYQSYVENISWQGEKSNGEEAGTDGRGLRLEALRIRLEGEISDYYDVYYRVHAENVGWLDWAKNGDDAGTAGYGYRLEGIEIILSEKDQNGNSVPPGKTTTPYKDKVNVIYRCYVQNIGAQKYVTNGTLAGTSGKSLRVEGMNIKIATTRTSGDIIYSTYVQDKGWMNEVKNGAYAGTTGQGLRMEAIKIRLTGELESKFDIYYRVHAQRFGWLGWAKNGEVAGTVGYNYRLEAVEIKLVPKGGAAPGATSNHYRERVEFIIDNMEHNRTILNVGETFQVKYHTNPAKPVNPTPRFEALNPDIATIDSNGLITAKSKGVANFVMYDVGGYMTAGFYVFVN